MHQHNLQKSIFKFIGPTAITKRKGTLKQKSHMVYEARTHAAGCRLPCPCQLCVRHGHAHDTRTTSVRHGNSVSDTSQTHLTRPARSNSARTPQRHGFVGLWIREIVPDSINLYNPRSQFSTHIWSISLSNLPRRRSVGFKASRPIVFLLLLWKELKYILLYPLLKEEQNKPDTSESSMHNNLRLLSRSSI